RSVAGIDVTPRVDVDVFACAFVASVVTGVLSGLALAWQAGRIPLMSSLKNRTATIGGVRLRKAFVIGQMAFTLILLVGAGLFVQTLTHLYQKGPGISTQLLTFGINLTSKGITTEEQVTLGQKLFTELRQLPGVENVAISGFRLLDGGSMNSNLTIESDR